MNHIIIAGEYLKHLFAVELGTDQTRETHAHIEKDLAKLSQSRERGYLIHIFRDITRSDTGTASRIRTGEKLEAVFRRVRERGIDTGEYARPVLSHKTCPCAPKGLREV